MSILLLAARDEEIDRLLGLEMGADDCLSKPFSARELLARVRAVLRRTLCTPGRRWRRALRPGSGSVSFRSVSAACTAAATCVFSERSSTRCSPSIAVNAGVPISRERLLAVSHGREQTVSLRAVDATMVRLRRAMEPDPAVPRYIQTARKHGYVFVPDEHSKMPA